MDKSEHTLPDGLTLLYEDPYNKEMVCKSAAGKAVSYPMLLLEGHDVWCWEPSPGHVLETTLSINIQKKPAIAVVKKPAGLKTRLVGKQARLISTNLPHC